MACPPPQGLVHALNVVTGSGRFYNYENEDALSESKLYEGHMLVANNTRADTVRFYMANFEHSHATMRIRGSYNVHVYGFKCEAPSALYVYDSDNVNVFGNGGDGAGGAEMNRCTSRWTLIAFDSATSSALAATRVGRRQRKFATGASLLHPARATALSCS